MIDLNLPLLLLGIALLWLPRGWLRRGTTLFKRRKRRRETEPWMTRETGDPAVNFRIEIAKFRNYVDLLRALAGCLVLMGGLGIEASLAAGDHAPAGFELRLLLVKAGILFVGLLIQMLRMERGHVSFFPPIFYLAGLSMGLCDIRGAIFAFVLIWSINPALGNAQGFLAVYAVLVTAFGLLFNRIGLRPPLAGALVFLPVLLSLLARRPLTILSRKGTRPPGTS